MAKNSLRPTTALLLFLILISLYRLQVASDLPLSPDEAYYFAWSRRPAVCYYDQPPMVAWVDWAFARPFDRPTAGTVRLGAVALSALSAWILFLAYREYRDDEYEAALFAMAFSVLPFTWLAGFLMIHDTSLLPWLAMSYWMLTRLAKHDGRAGDWLLFSLCLTGAMYAKFSAFMMVWGLVLYMLISPRGRRWWKTWPPYAAGLVSALLYSPVLWWNANNDWISLQAISELTPGKELSPLKRLEYASEYAISQVGIFSPLVGLTVFAALGKGIRDTFRDPGNFRTALPTCLAVPIFAYFLVQSLSSHVFGNWPGIAYIPASMLAMKEVSDAWQRRRAPWVFGPRFVKAGMTLNIVLLLLMSLHLQFRIFRPLLDRIEDRFGLKDNIDWRLDQDYAGWDAMTALVEGARGDADFILARHYQTASMLEFMLPDRPFVESYSKASRRGSQWDLWSTLEQRKGQTALFVDTRPMVGEVLDRCAEVKPVARNVAVGDPNRPEKTWYLYLCRGWKGP